jgi:membrane-associated phospholipid phosphatase
VSDPPIFPARPWLVAGVTTLVGFVLVTLLVLHSGGSDALDRVASGAALSVRTPGMTAVARIVTGVGSWPVVLAATAVAAGFAWERTGQLRRPATLLAVMLLTASVVYLLKVAVGRPNPVAGLVVRPSSSGYAFPSGHTTDVTVLYVLAALLLSTAELRVRRAVALAAAAALALLVGLSRVYLGYHWASDVLAGWLLGASIAAFAYALVGSLTSPAPAPPELDRASQTPALRGPTG